MSTQRWQMREYEQKRLIEALFDAVTEQSDDDGEELSWDNCIYALSVLLLRALPKFPDAVKLLRHAVSTKTAQEQTIPFEAVAILFGWLDHDMTAQRPICMRSAMVVTTIAKFAKTRGEAEHLLWQFYMRLNQSLQSRFTRDHDRERVHNQEALYGGPGMDDVPPQEHDARSAAAENMKALLVRPI